MAKQSGLHQLRGKVGEHSYYRQTGIASGLVRSINQGMSSRVKNDEAFANTRLNNAEFGQAGRIASVLAQYISPKFRPMILPFSQSKMAKIILEYIKADSSAPWGERNISQANSAEMQVAALNSVVKNRFEDFGLTLSNDEETGALTMTTTAETVNKISDIGANGFDYRFVAATTWIGTYLHGLDGVGRYAASYARANSSRDEVDNPTDGESTVITYTLRPAPPSGFPVIEAIRTGILIILPYRVINSEKHYLQEHCTFKAFALNVDGAIN